MLEKRLFSHNFVVSLPADTADHANMQWSLFDYLKQGLENFFVPLEIVAIACGESEVVGSLIGMKTIGIRD